MELVNLRLLTVVILCSFCSIALSSDVTYADTIYGPVIGYTTPTHKIWLGVPYAAPPLGDLRFAPPKAPVPWTSALNATVHGKGCIQPDSGVGSVDDQSEDCLYLDIYVPINHDTVEDPPLPVMFWIHGGSFIYGAASLYNGTRLSSDKLVFVATNYRLGAFGFLSHSSLLSDTQNSTGFYGMQDQRFALKWVQENIRNFGGDPTKVTLSGESAGAVAVCVHFATPLSWGLFSKAIMESGYCTIDTREEGFEKGLHVVNNMGCGGLSDADTLTCIRAKAPADILSAYSSDAYTIDVYSPAIFPSELFDQPYKVIINGNSTHVPLLIGTNLNESTLFTCDQVYDRYPSGLTNITYAVLIQEQIAHPDDLPKLLEVYPTSVYPSATIAYNDFMSDFNFKCASRSVADNFVKNGAAVYMYSFEIPLPTLASLIYRSHPDCVGVAHTFELPFLFDIFEVQSFGIFKLTDDQQVLAQTIRDLWASFIADSAPSPSIVDWPAYTQSTSPYVVFGSADSVTITTNSLFRKTTCDVVDTVEPSNGTIPFASTTTTTGAASTTTTSGDVTNAASGIAAMLTAAVAVLPFICQLLYLHANH